MNGRRFAWLGFGGLAATVGGCQLVSGLSGYQDSGGTATGTATAAGTGGATSTSSTAASAGGSATASSASSSGSSTSGSGGAGGVTVGVGGSTGSAMMGSSSSGSGCANPGETFCDLMTGCVDLTSNNAHCGSCTHACAAIDGTVGGCMTSVCVPVALSEAYPLNTPITAVAADPAVRGVFWAASKGLGELHGIDSNGLPHTLPAVNGKVGGLATRGNLVFYTANTVPAPGVYQWDLVASTSIGLDTDASLIDVGAVVTSDGKKVVWAGARAASAPVPWPVYWTPVGDVTPNPYSDDSATHFAADGQRVYWPYKTSHFERLVSATGATDAVISVVFVHPDHVAADADPSPSGHLYGISTGQLFRISKNNIGTQNVDLETQVAIGTPTGLAVSPSGGSIYWLEDSTGGGTNGRVMRLDSWNQGQPAKVVLTGLIHPANLAIDDKYLYYVSQPTLIDKTRLVYGVER